MSNGYCGRVMRVNLSKEKISFESPDDSFYRIYGGGRGLISYYLLRELEQNTDPLGASNKLIFATGVLTGSPIPGAGRHSVGAKSPLTGGYGDGEAGGYWGTELKKAGFDALIIEGTSRKPVYLWINDSNCEIRDGSSYWGKSTLEVQSQLRRELGNHIHIAQIGPAGEKLVRYACVVHDLRHYTGRCGIGAVMGSKKLRAVAVRGSGKVGLADPDSAKKLIQWFGLNHKLYTRPLQEYGTLNIWESVNTAGGLPTRNFQEGTFEHADKLSSVVFNQKFLVGRESCHACPVRCKPKLEIGPPHNVLPDFGGPEYETVAAFGSNCGVSSPEAVAVANQICGENGVDTISAGVCISFAMECFEKGLIGLNETEGIELRFGNPEAMIAMLKKIVKREGFGNILAEGVMRASKHVGRGSENFAMHVKCQEVPLHEPRWKHGLGLGYAVSATGADHHHNIHDTLFETETKAFKDMKALGILETLPCRDLSLRKVRMYIYATLWRHLADSVGFCTFLPWDYSQIEEIFRVVTGWNTTTLEMQKMMERAIVMTRLFNLREGLGCGDDDIPPRFKEQFSSGPLRGVAIDDSMLKKAIKSYYQMVGWSENGIPTEFKLYELGLEWLVK